MFTLSLAHTLLLLAFIPQSIAVTCPGTTVVQNDLGKSLSRGSSISSVTSDAPRWSLYAAPTPALVVNVGSERDVATIVGSSPQQYNYVPADTKLTGPVLQQEQDNVSCSKPG